MLHEAIHTLLDQVTTKNFPQIVPQGTALPYIKHFKVSTTPNRTKSGPSTLDEIRWQVSCFALTLNEAETMAESVRTKLDNYTGHLNGVFIDRINFTNEQSLYEDGAKVHHVATDYSIRLKRTSYDS